MFIKLYTKRIGLNKVTHDNVYRINQRLQMIHDILDLNN